MIERVWTATVSWGSDGRDLDIFSTVTAGGQTSSGVGWNNGRETTKVVVQNNQVNGTFYAIWGGDNTSFAGSETVTIYFRGERLPTGNVEVATLTTHLNFYGEGSSPVTMTVANQAGSYTGSANTRYSNRAEASDPAIVIPILANGGSAESKYLIELSTFPDGGGTAFGGGLFSSGDSCTVSASPKSGATFIGWYEGSTLVSPNASYTFSVTADRSLVAHFTVQVEVVAEPTDGGTVSGGGNYAIGDSCTITASPAAGYKFVNWTSSGGQTVSTTSHTFAVTGDITWTAHFEHKRVWVIAAQSPGHSGGVYVNPYATPYDVQKCNYGASGDSVHLLATNNAGWRFVRWTGPGGYTSPSSDVTVALSESYVETNKVYDSSLRDYTIVFTAEFEPTAYNTVKMRILEGADYGTLQGMVLYWTPDGSNSADVSKFVTVVKDTASEYEVRVPVTYYPKMAKTVTGPTQGSWTDTVPLLVPDMTRNRHVYKYVVTLNGAAETWEAPPRKDPVPPMYDWALGYFDENSYYDMESLWQRAEYLTPYVAQETGNGAALTVDFYLKRVGTGNILCTGAGKILCDSSRKMMFDG